MPRFAKKPLASEDSMRSRTAIARRFAYVGCQANAISVMRRMETTIRRDLRFDADFDEEAGRGAVIAKDSTARCIHAKDQALTLLRERARLQSCRSTPEKSQGF